MYKCAEIVGSTLFGADVKLKCCRYLYGTDNRKEGWRIVSLSVFTSYNVPQQHAYDMAVKYRMHGVMEMACLVYS